MCIELGVEALHVCAVDYEAILARMLMLVQPSNRPLARNDC
jgi:hypothetical protein